MTSLAALCLAAAVLVGARPRTHVRFRAVFVRPRQLVVGGDPRRWAAPAVVALVVVAVGVGAIGPALAAAIIGGTVLWLLHRGIEGRAETERDESLARAMGIVIDELSIGSPTASACGCAGSELLADDPSSPVGHDLAVLAARVHLGGEVTPIAAGSATGIAAVWSAATRYGLPLVELLSASRADLLARRRFAAHTAAALAGPRATARVLAVLPLLGLVLGQGIGADPLRVLLTPGAGAVLLVVGTALAAAGVVWSERIIDKAVR